MGRTAVNDEENTVLGTGHQPRKKLDENIGVDATFFLDHEPHMASRGHRRDETHAVPRSGTHDNRCLSPFAPGPACMMIRAHMRRVAEEYIRFSGISASAIAAQAPRRVPTHDTTAFDN